MRPVLFWTWSSSSLCYFPFAWLADTACWFWLPHSLYPVGTVSHSSGHTRSLSPSTHNTTPHTRPIHDNLQVQVCVKVECKKKIYIFFFLKDDNLNDPMVLKKEGFCNCNCIKSKWIKHFEYSFNNCSTANVVVVNCVVRGQSGL